MGNKKTIVLGIVAIAIIVAFGIISASAFNNPSKTIINENNTLSNNKILNNDNTSNKNNLDPKQETQKQETQTATLSFKNYEYVLTPNTLKKGIPVKITVDTKTVNGCMRSVVIKDFGVRKYVTPTDNIIEFTPNKEGKFLIACSMNMGKGFFSVN
ncbi:MAG: cupredoxin domain-containing protein [archaeon]|jgi:heme/copper-type cytochrome/quinol oxidase subunit 2|nr:cupredoxin domain-containing protein [archaeon]MDD2477687.1 cupredoxin domain-containing protein [Candidatus ainarchaeum sp.]MDD3084539.1 cupredoxin domain-containing protein [Candidatus ainarchaeum sp.]MDD4221263.1 cupredoxin domain-containing protein [Candidatus ainarchaeum sp.]MDD4662803.1 cupredoxin domain-containing protein [Candidatus ainarchaeum sp.]